MDFDYEMHTFLLDANGTLHEPSKRLPNIREYIEELPETAATFRLKQVDGIYQPNFDDVHLEFCHAWPVHEIYAPENERVYVNPNYIHAHTYTDLVAECQCGTTFTRNYEDDHNSLRDEHNHSDDCLPHWRLKARAAMTEQRYNLMHRLGKLGWKGADMAPRLGAHTRAMGPYAEQFNTSIGDVYAEYRRIAANTYRYLVHEADESSTEVANVYGHARTTLTRWANEWAEVELSSGIGDDV